MRHLRLLWVPLVLFLSWSITWAAEPIVTFDSPEQQRLYSQLLREYRCLKCQNQNLSDSNASLASDLRREIREQILAGKQKADIDAYLVARYGEFVLYRPRFSSKTAVLWLGPFVLLLFALFAAWRILYRRSDRGLSQASGEAQDSQAIARLQRARQLLDD